jgi:hypothetical protein
VDSGLREETRVRPTAATHLEGNLFGLVACRGLSGVFAASCRIRAPRSAVSASGKGGRNIRNAPGADIHDQSAFGPISDMALSPLIQINGESLYLVAVNLEIVLR